MVPSPFFLSSSSYRLLLLWSPSLLLLLLLLLPPSTLAVGTDDQVNAPIDYGTFASPSSNVRPRFRYWVNDASVNLSQVADDVRSLAHAGAGGLELLGYYLYGDTGSFGGGNNAPLQSDWTVYGFGGEPWKNLQDTVLETAQEEGIVVDLAQGPNQGAGIPAPYNDEGLLWNLAPFRANLSQQGTATDQVVSIPGWGGSYNGDSLVAAVVARVVADNGSHVTLAASSLEDVTSLVSPANGSLHLDLDGADNRDGHVLFAFYQERSRYREVAASDQVEAAVPQSPIETYQQNGSWVVDHFSAAGAQLLIDFWNKSLLYDANTTEGIRKVGNFLWEDSQEYGGNNSLFWTPQLADVFVAHRGYHMAPWLPVIVSADLTGLTTFAGVTYVTDEEDAGVGHVEDYEQTLTELNAEYLSTLTTWANSLGIQFSAQVVYNLPMDMLANIPLVNGPECETLGFNHLIDGYRQFAGPAHLAGKRIISSEAGALYGAVYQQTIPDLLWDLARSLAGGVNAFVLHGFPFGGDYGNTTWPGFVTFNYAFSEMHGPRQPAWAFADEWLDWVGRMQYVAQKGVPRVDLAFWSKRTSYRTITSQYVPTDLVEAGFTYEYLSPDNLDLPTAVVVNGTLAPDGPAFQALVVAANASLTPAGVAHLVDYANQGLPLVFSGGLPTKVIGAVATTTKGGQVGEKNLTATLETLLGRPHVHVVPATNLAASLLALGFRPRTALSETNGSWYTQWREDTSTGTQYVFVYHDATGVPLGEGAKTVGNITLATRAANKTRPFLLDAWTGAKTPLAAYQQSETSLTVQLQLAGNQSVVLALEEEEEEEESPLYITSGASLLSGPAMVNAASASETDMDTNNKTLALLTTYTSSPQTLVLSTGRTTTLAPMRAPASTLSNWTLTVEAWGPPSSGSLYDIEAGASKTNTTPYHVVLAGDAPALLPWSDMDPVGLTNVSGRGYYHTTFTWPPLWSSSNSSEEVEEEEVTGAFLDLGPLLHTAQLRLNGHLVPPLDPTWARADLGAYLVPGTNEVDVVVSTPLGNGLRGPGVWDALVNSGKLATSVMPSPPAVMPYGLVGEVRLVPYRRDVVKG